jgi:hypothetical protein
MAITWFAGPMKLGQDLLDAAAKVVAGNGPAWSPEMDALRQALNAIDPPKPSPKKKHHTMPSWSEIAQRFGLIRLHGQPTPMTARQLDWVMPRHFDWVNSDYFPAPEKTPFQHMIEEELCQAMTQTGPVSNALTFIDPNHHLSRGSINAPSPAIPLHGSAPGTPALDPTSPQTVGRQASTLSGKGGRS